jgi:hypothetical protein
MGVDPPIGDHHLTGAFYVGNGWEWENGIIINSYGSYGSFPHSQLSISKKNSSVPGIKEAGGGIETKKATEIPNINHLPIFSTSISSRMPDA